MNGGMLRKVTIFGFVAVAAAAGYSTPLIGRAVGGMIGRAAAHEAAEAAAKQSLKTGVERGVSSALAGVTAKQLMGAGIMVAAPIAAYNLSAGTKMVDEARAEVIRTTGMAAAKEIPNRPELVGEILSAADGTAGSSLTRMKRWFDQTLPWGCGVAGLGCLIYLLGFLRHAVAYARRGSTVASAEGRPEGNMHESMLT